MSSTSIVVDGKAATLATVNLMIKYRTDTNPLIVAGAAALVGYLGFV